jgi:ribosomal protein S18 acetylase RimI-like enzyme
VLRELVQRAYGHYVERIGMRPIPMDADYDAAVSAARAWVAEIDGEIAGLLVLVAHDDHLLVENVAVEPSRQHQGVGRALLAFAEQHAAELGLGELRLYTHVKMTENQALYARLGYREVGRRSEQGRSAVFMSKRIDE